MKNYFYKLLFKYLSLYVFTTDKLVSIFPESNNLISQFPQGKAVIDDSIIKSCENGIRNERLGINEIKTYTYNKGQAKT
jgi:hypothetical protein